MKLLLVEDDPTHGPFLVEQLSAALPGVDLLRAESRDTAIQAIAGTSWDLIVCDLKIPAEDGGLDAAVEHGLAVRGEAQSLSPGTPLVIQSAFNTVEIAQELMLAAEKRDVYGSGTPEPMLTFFKKTQLDECIEAAKRHQREILRLAQIEVVGSVSPVVRRVLRVFASRHHSNRVNVAAIGGGLSGARVMRAECLKDAALTARVLARVTDKDSAAAEVEGFDRYVAPMLSAGSFSPRMAFQVIAPGRDVGLFYTLIGSGEVTLCDILKKDGAEAAAIVRHLAQDTRAWWEAGIVQNQLVSEIRRTYVSDSDYAAVLPNLGAGPWTDVESRTIQVRLCPEHGDLHAFNVLIDKARPILIDFGDIGIKPSACDPSTLELSTHFHTRGLKCEGEWRKHILSGHWWNDDLKPAGALEPYIAACRIWAADRAGERERLACSYSYAVRQLKYKDTDHELAAALARSAATALIATFNG